VDAAAETLPLRCIEETRQGLSHARNRALAEFAGGVLLFTDDDMVLERDWLQSYASAIERFRHASYFGGRILPLWEASRPEWVRDEGMALIAGVLGHYDLGTEDRYYATEDPLPFGASFAVNRELASRLDGFRTDLGVVGRIPGRGEESAYLTEAVAAGARGVYVGRALARHSVDPRNLQPMYLFRHGIQTGVAAFRTQRPAEAGSYQDVLLYFLKALAQLAKGRADRARQCVVNAGIQVGLRRASGRPAR
jgi:GT2 family glycosyltransferase